MRSTSPITPVCSQQGGPPGGFQGDDCRQVLRERRPDSGKHDDPDAGGRGYPCGAFHRRVQLLDASNYNRNLKPACVMVRGGEARVVIQAETYADLVA
jgi:hypothetical protein